MKAAVEPADWGAEDFETLSCCNRVELETTTQHHEFGREHACLVQPGPQYILCRPPVGQELTFRPRRHRMSSKHTFLLARQLWLEGPHRCQQLPA